MRLFAPLHLLLLAVLSARCAAQVAPVQNRYHVTGIVVNSATGAPIRRALVRIGLVEPVLTGADGRFQVDSPEGRVGFSAQKPGFVDSGVPQNGLVSPFPYFTVGPGKNDIVIKLSPEGTVQGRVVDADGEPIEGVPVQLTMQAIVNGRKQSQPRQSRSTNEDGTYRMDALTPGTYLVQTDVHPVFTYYDPAFPPGQFPQVYPQSFYPGSPDISGAQPIELKPGEVAQADFTLSPVRAFRVSGSIAGAQHGVLVFLQGAERQQIRMLTNFDQKTGHFVLPSVPPGVWSLRFLSASDQGTYEAEQTVTIDSSDVDGVQVLLQPLPSIRVNVDTQGEAAAPQLQIQLVPKDSQHSGGRLFAVTQTGGPKAR